MARTDHLDVPLSSYATLEIGASGQSRFKEFKLEQRPVTVKGAREAILAEVSYLDDTFPGPPVAARGWIVLALDGDKTLYELQIGGPASRFDEALARQVLASFQMS